MSDKHYITINFEFQKNYKVIVSATSSVIGSLDIDTIYDEEDKEAYIRIPIKQLIKNGSIA